MRSLFGGARGAGISHGMERRLDGGNSASPRENVVAGLHMTDALIAAVCEMRGTEPLYTGTVQDFEKPDGPADVVFRD